MYEQKRIFWIWNSYRIVWILFISSVDAQKCHYFEIKKSETIVCVCAMCAKGWRNIQINKLPKRRLIIKYMCVQCKNRKCALEKKWNISPSLNMQEKLMVRRKSVRLCAVVSRLYMFFPSLWFLEGDHTTHSSSLDTHTHDVCIMSTSLVNGILLPLPLCQCKMFEKLIVFGNIRCVRMGLVRLAAAFCFNHWTLTIFRQAHHTTNTH